MTPKDDKIKGLFGSKLSGFEPEVPSSVWEGIDRLLSQQSFKQTEERKPRIRVQRTALIALAVAASLAIGIFIVFESKQIQLVNIVEEVEPKEIERGLHGKETTKEDLTESKKVIAQATTRRSTSGKPMAKRLVVEDDYISIGADGPIDGPPHNPEMLIEDLRGNQQHPSDRQIDGSERRQPIEDCPPLPLLQKNSRGNKMSLSLRSNAGGLSQDVENSGGGVLFSKTTRSKEFAQLLKQEGRDYKLSHKQPISVGLTVSKQVSNDVSLETGLMFTYLSSKISSNSAVNLKEEQVFGYLGIPFYVNYNFYELGKARFYISLGFTMQKDVFGEYTSEVVNVREVALQLDNTLKNPFSSQFYSEPSFVKEDISQKHWQFSSHLTAGVSYPIYKKLKAYTSIGGAYYFDANNEYRTTYSDREFQLDLNLGLRVDF